MAVVPTLICLNTSQCPLTLKIHMGFVTFPSCDKNRRRTIVRLDTAILKSGCPHSAWIKKDWSLITGCDGERKSCGLCHWAGACGGMTTMALFVLATAATWEHSFYLSSSAVKAATEPQRLNKYQNHRTMGWKGP